MNVMASPPLPQPWQWKTCLAGETLNDGVFSWWNGQRPVMLSPPAFFSVRYCETSLTMSVRSRTASTSSCLILPANGAPGSR